MLTSPRLQSDLKYHNLRLVYDIVRQKGAASRREISKITGMSPTSMTRIVATLCESGLISEDPNPAPRSPDAPAGRPAILLNACNDVAYCLCIDLAVDCCKAVISDMANHVVYQRQFHAPAERSFSDIMRDINRSLPDMSQEAGIERDRILACGISVAGHVNNKNGHIIVAGRFEWTDVDARTIARNVFCMPVIVENDCKASLIGEAHLRVNSDKSQNMVYLKFGKTGVGAAAIIEGRILRGAINAAGEVGHMTVLPGGEICNCGRRGCVETLLAENFIVERAKKVQPDIDTMEKLLQEYNNNNPVAVSIFDEVSRFIAITVNNVSCAYNPDIIVTDGSFLEQCPKCYDNAMEQLKYQLVKSIHPHVQVVHSKMGENSGIYGIGIVTIEKCIINLLISAPLED